MLQQDTLSTAASSNDDERFSFLNRQINSTKNGLTTDLFHQIMDGDHGNRGGFLDTLGCLRTNDLGFHALIILLQGEALSKLSLVSHHFQVLHDRAHNLKLLPANRAAFGR